MLESALMLDNVEEHEKATRLREALDAQLASGQHLTGDLGGSASTSEFTQQIIARL